MKHHATILSAVAVSASLLTCAAGALAQQPAEKPKAPAPVAPATPAAEKPAAAPVGDPYPLATCPISGEKLGSMGNPIIKLYDGREVRFCCDSCPPAFEKNQPKSIAALDKALITDQLPLYPIDTSLLTGKKLPEKPLDWVYNNRLVRSADDAEKAEILKDPAKHLAALDKATIEKQTKDYPLKACPVSSQELGAMGEPKDVVLAGRLVRLCCASCEKDIRKEPSKFIAMIDEARKAAAARGKKDADTHKDHGHADHKH